ncbi:MAG TPA: hypothetical protein DEH25_14345 [Chloroflexi bacterium]|nr:hypothetical protein [Chloroflexota bacterium]
MGIRIDRVVKSPGTFSGGKAYSLIVDGDQLYLIEVGPGSTELFQRGANFVAQAGIDKARQRMLAKIEPGEKRLAEMGPEAISVEKGSFKFALSEVYQFEYGKNLYGYFQLKLKAGKQKMTLYVAGIYEPGLDQIAALVR